MGGKAIQGVRRYAAAEFYAAQSEIMKILRDLFPDVRFHAVRSYGDKQSFGDLDIVFDTSQMPGGWRTMLEVEIRPSDVVRNGPVTSMAYKDLQVDFIGAQPEEYDIACAYFDYNDMGNLLGRLARSVGLKFGSMGLMLPVVISKHTKPELLVTRDMQKILEVLGLDYFTYQQGFPNLNSIFEFVTSSKLFSPLSFDLSLRTSKDRTRDVTRPTYMAFLQYVKEHKMPHGEHVAKAKDYSWVLGHLVRTVPSFCRTLADANDDWEAFKLYDSRFGRRAVSTLLNITGPALGAVMQALRSDLPELYALAEQGSKEDCEQLIKSTYKEYQDGQQEKGS